MKLSQQDTQLPISKVRVNEAPTLEKANKFIRHSKLFSNNVRALIIGSSGCGKTSPLLSLIYHPHGISFKNIYIFSKSLYQPKYQELAMVMRSIPEKIGYFTFKDNESILSPDDIQPFSVMIFDNVASVSNKNQHLQSFYSMGCHKNLDTFFLCQSYSIVPKQLVRDNANVILLFCQDTLNLKHVFEDHVIPDMKFKKFCELCSYAWNAKDFGCLSINKDFDLDNGQYCLGFDNYITL